MKKKIALICTAVVLVAAIAVGGTLALLTKKTDTKTNVFTVGAGINIELKEPAWDNDQFTGEADATPDDELGKDLAVDFVPGRVIPKDPAVKNISEAESVWIAVKVNATCGETTGDSKAALEAIDAFAAINWDTMNWTQSESDPTVYYFNKIVAKGEKTTPLFDKVTIDSTATMDTMEGFTIDITGYAVQAAGVDEDAAHDALDALIAG